uniref:Retrotransposon Copia-like N-terminal domain-containing protein n=1 Tax=Manihot esculenta TaxID=3983 RepID=A0A2C9UPU7_MANES
MANQPLQVVNQPNDYLQNLSNPYYLHPNENSALIFVSLPLNAMNYHLWARAMKMLLLSKNKIKFIDGTLPAPAKTNQMFLAWKRCNTTVVSWITKCLSPSIIPKITKCLSPSIIPKYYLD